MGGVYTDLVSYKTRVQNFPVPYTQQSGLSRFLPALTIGCGYREMMFKLKVDPWSVQAREWVVSLTDERTGLVEIWTRHGWPGKNVVLP